MKIFVDSANLGDIEEALKRGFPAGVTTNPSIVAQEEKGDFTDRMRAIIALLKQYGAPIPLSVEVFSSSPKEMIRQAEAFTAQLDYPALYIKIPIGWNELAVIRELKQRGMKVNCTCCMSFSQALLAARAGADFVSLFYGRIRDGGADPAVVVRHVRSAYAENGIPAEIIVGSIRKVQDITEAFLSGAHIVTVPPRFFREMAHHPKTDEVVGQFLADFAAWMK
jgi:transaldolase